MPIATGTTLTNTTGCVSDAAYEPVLTFTQDGTEFISCVVAVSVKPVLLTAFRLPPGAHLVVEMLYGCDDDIVGPYMMCGCRPSMHATNRLLPLGVSGRYRLRLSGTSLTDREDMFITYREELNLDWLAMTNALGCCGGTP